VFTAGGNVPCSGALWNGRFYIGCTDGNLYCFDNTPVVATEIFADSDKGATMWNNETITVGGRLISHPEELVWKANFAENGTYLGGIYVAEPSIFAPPLPNQTVKLSLTTPDSKDVSLNTTTDKDGYFEFSYTPAEVGEWGWVIYYDANVKESITYDASYGEWHPISVTSPTPVVTPPPTTSPTPSPGAGTPVEYIYAAVAVIVIVIIAIGAYAYTKRSKKQ
jgi:hypothetical protein